MDYLKHILQDVIDKEGAEAVLNYIKTIESSEDVQEYLEGFLDMKNSSHRKALETVLQLKSPKAPAAAYSSIAQAKYDIGSADGQDDLNFDVKVNRGNKKSKSKSLGSSEVPQEAQFHHGDATKKKTKFVPLFSETGQRSVMLPGRNPCDCLASKHELVNNCLNCGRIVCAQEGSGECYTCGQLVCSKAEKEVLDRQSKKSDKLRAHLLKQSWADPVEIGGDTGKENRLSGRDPMKEASLDAAIAHKNRLLEFDRSSARRTRVIDDEMDYFAADRDVWLSPDERGKLKAKEEALRAMRHASRRSAPASVTLDFAGRRVVAEDTRSAAAHAMYSQPEEEPVSRVPSTSGEGLLINRAEGIERPTFVSSLIERKNHATVPANSSDTERSLNRRTLRLQDGELQELSDNGMGLSMHQPWASLLVKGIKKDEGRTWYTSHRGRLWIAAAAKPPSPEEIKEIEAFYKSRGFRQDSFPKEYPVGCLLGCVDVQECLPQEDYRLQYPDGESESPFVFVCKHPKELVVKFPIKGKHNIYKLDSHIHEAAKRGLR